MKERIAMTRENSNYTGDRDLPESAVYSNSRVTQVKGYLLTFFGGCGSLAFGISLLIVLITGLFFDGSALTVGVPVAILLPFFLISFLGLYKGMTALSRIRHFKNYVRILGRRTCISLSELAQNVGKSEGSVQKQIRKMIESGMFRQGHLDAEGKNFFVMDDSYDAYMLNKQNEAEKNAYKNNEALTDEVKHLIAQGKESIMKIRLGNELIADAAVSRKLDELEMIITKIFEYVEQHPESADETKKLMKYYLPTTIKLLDFYQKLDNQPVQGKNIRSSKKQIEETLDTLNLAFARLYDNLYQDTSMDINADISVLQTLLAQEGLTGERI